MFLTLTYAPEHLPPYGALRKDHLQKFIKRLRRDGLKIRYYAVGEYGEQLSRPHYHIILFGFWPSDSYIWRTKGGYNFYRSDYIEKKWPYGYCDYSSVTRSNCDYVARYVTKKIGGAMANDHYEKTLPDGTLYYLPPEFSVMSLKPPIGKAWIEKYWQETYDTDSVVLDGKEYPVPEFYDKWLKSHHPDVWDEVLEKRQEYCKSEKCHLNSTPKRLEKREIVAQAAHSQRTRSYEATQ